jgi:DNA (cytosine-5)-methyltransferase 1
VIYGSVCTGISAEHVAWSHLGWTAAWFSEIDPFCCALLKHHYPEVPNLGDMTDVEKFTGPIDILVGGTPCQGFSVAGLRGGLADERSNLALGYIELAKRLRPRWTIWENVFGVLSSNGGRDFGTFMGQLAELGYGLAWACLDAQHFGVPQRRRRVFLVGYLGDWRRAYAVLFNAESLCRYSQKSREAGEGFTHDVAGSLEASGRGVERAGESRGQDPVIAARQTGRGFFTEGLPGLRSHPGGQAENIVGTLAASGAGSARPAGQCNETDMLVAHTLSAEGFDASEDGTGRGTPIVADCLTANWHRSKGAKAGNQVGVVNPVIECYTIQTNDGGKHKRRDRPEGGMYVKEADVALTVGGTDRTVCFEPGNLRRQCGSEPNEHTAPTLGAEKQGDTFPHIAQHMAVRRLTPVECEKLQGHSPGYTDIPYRGKPAADGPRYRALGNGIAVPVLRWIGERIQMVDALALEVG